MFRDTNSGDVDRWTMDVTQKHLVVASKGRLQLLQKTVRRV